MEKDQSYQVVDSYQQSQYQGVQSAEIATSQVEYAGFWIRFAANFVDGLIIFVPCMTLVIIAGLVIGADNINNSGLLDVVVRLISMFIGWIYFVYMTHKYNATLGKKAFGIKVVSEKSEKLTFGQTILRETIGKLISSLILCIGYIMAGFTSKKQALHDKIAGTLVVYKDSNKKVSGWIVAVVAIIPIFLIIGIGILSSVALVSLNGARGKAQDASIKSSLYSMSFEAMLYRDENSSYKGYKSINTHFECSGQSVQPIVNISKDGKEMAIFVKSCNEKDKYFCANPETQLITKTAEVDESYVKGGATICNTMDISEY